MRQGAVEAQGDKDANTRNGHKSKGANRNAFPWRSSIQRLLSGQLRYQRKISLCTEALYPPWSHATYLRVHVRVIPLVPLRSTDRLTE